MSHSSSLLVGLSLSLAVLSGCGGDHPSSVIPEPGFSRVMPAPAPEYREAERCARRWGVRLHYVPGSEHAVLSGGDRELICGPGLRSALIDGRPFHLQDLVTLEDGRLMLPLELVDAADRAWAHRPLPAQPERPEMPAPVAALHHGEGRRFHIVIDAGHGGCLTGAQGVDGTWEKTVTLKIARELKDVLEADGAEVTMLRESDRVFFPPSLAGAGYKDQQKADLEERVRLANAARPDLFVSIHANWAPTSDAEGFEVYYPRAPFVPPPAPVRTAKRSRRSGFDWSAYGADTSRVLDRLAGATDREETRWQDSRSLAESVRRTLHDALSTPDRGARTADFKVIRESAVPAILVETGFLSSPAEEKRLVTPSYQRRLAEALAQGITRFMSSRR